MSRTVTDVAAVVRREWERQLGSTTDEGFFAAGGNSLEAAELMAALSREFGTRLRLALLLRNLTLPALTKAVSEAVGAEA